MRWVLAAAAPLVLSGCATALAMHQTAKPVEPLHVQVDAGAGLYTPLGGIGQAVAQGVHHATKLADLIANKTEYTLSEDEQHELLTAGIALAVLPPAPVYTMSLRTGLFANADLGLRYSINAARLDAKYRFIHMDDGPNVPDGSQRSFDVALGVAISRYLFDNPVVDSLKFVHLGDFSRWDLEVPLYFSWELGHVAHLYGGPRYVYSRTSFDAILVNTSEQASNISGLDLTLPEQVDVHFIGATAGLMVGYKYVYLILEMTGGYTSCRPVVMGRRRDLGGPTFFPSVGLALRL
jgi:hypothetical protein